MTPTSGMRFRQLPHVAQLYVAVVLSLTLLALALAHNVSQTATQAPFDVFVLLVVAAAVAHSFPVSTSARPAYHVSLPFVVAAIILFSPLQLVVLIGAMHTAEWLRRRRSGAAQIFNFSAFAVSALVAQAAYGVLWPAQSVLATDLGQPANLVAGVVAAAVFALLNRILISVAIWLGNRISPRKQHIFEAEGLLTDSVLLLMGVPMAHLALLAPWAAAVGAAPLWLIYRALDLPNVRAKSRQDGLTELFNGPYLAEASARELSRARRFNRPLTLLLVDLDGLGELNNEHGHQAGDAVLQGAAHSIRDAKREYDLAARLAGGLFAVLLPETDLTRAQGVAERIRRGIADGRYEIPSSIEQTRLTVSIGGAVLQGGDATSTHLFEAAQSALARAKGDGGDRIEFGVVTPNSPPTVGAPAVAAEAMQVQVPAGSPQRQGPTLTPLPAARRSDVPGQVVVGLVTLLLGVGLLWSTVTLDWRRLLVFSALAALAGLAFSFKSVTAALALAIEVRGSPGLWTARYWRLWPMYLALGVTGFLVAYAYYRVGVLGALATIAVAMVFHYLVGRYVDRTFESVRKLRSANQQLEVLAFHDPLTRLANRALFAERLGHAMVRAGDGTSIAVLFVDLDNFKTVNDTLGHAVGDALLIATTDRLRTCVRREDTIARLGGDEFTVLLEDMRDPSDAARMAERIGEALRTPFELEGHPIVVSSSIGIALDTDRTHGPEDLMREADMAMYRAKAAGRARYEIFDTGMGTRATARLELETELRGAIERDELVLHYQPVVNLASGTLEAVEAVLRWQHPRRGLLDTAEFRGVAEQAGIVPDLVRWALERACCDGAAWQAERPGLVVQLSVSATALERPSFVGEVATALGASGLPSTSLMLAVAESVLASDGEAVATTFDALQALGVLLAVDDVGAGVSSVAWLSRLPLDVLKIAASAVDSPVLVRAVVGLGSALGIAVNARGVVRNDQAAALKVFGCRQAQGALYGGPQSRRSIANQLTTSTDLVPRAA